LDKCTAVNYSTKGELVNMANSTKLLISTWDSRDGQLNKQIHTKRAIWTHSKDVKCRSRWAVAKMVKV